MAKIQVYPKKTTDNDGKEITVYCIDHEMKKVKVRGKTKDRAVGVGDPVAGPGLEQSVFGVGSTYYIRQELNDDEIDELRWENCNRLTSARMTDLLDKFRLVKNIYKNPASNNIDEKGAAKILNRLAQEYNELETLLKQAVTGDKEKGEKSKEVFSL